MQTCQALEGSGGSGTLSYVAGEETGTLSEPLSQHDKLCQVHAHPDCPCLHHPRRRHVNAASILLQAANGL